MSLFPKCFLSLSMAIVVAGCVSPKETTPATKDEWGPYPLEGYHESLVYVSIYDDTGDSKLSSIAGFLISMYIDDHKMTETYTVGTYLIGTHMRLHIPLGTHRFKFKIGETFSEELSVDFKDRDGMYVSVFCRVRDRDHRELPFVPSMKLETSARPIPVF